MPAAVYEGDGLRFPLKPGSVCHVPAIRTHCQKSKQRNLYDIGPDHSIRRPRRSHGQRHWRDTEHQPGGQRLDGCAVFAFCRTGFRCFPTDFLTVFSQSGVGSMKMSLRIIQIACGDYQSPKGIDIVRFWQYTC